MSLLQPVPEERQSTGVMGAAIFDQVEVVSSRGGLTPRGRSWAATLTSGAMSPPVVSSWARRCRLGSGTAVFFPSGYHLELMWL